LKSLHATIKAIEYYLPGKGEDNALLQAENPDWRFDEIEKKTGIKKRWISNDAETSVDLAYHACNKLLEKFPKQDIDGLIFVTQSADYFLPSSAGILQDRLGISVNSSCFDINLGCSGFVYGLSIVSSLIESGLVKNVLLVCAETYTKYIDKNDRVNRPIFSDGASATLVSASKAKNIGPFLLGSDGAGSQDLIVEKGAARSGFRTNGGPPLLHMDGSKVFMFTLSTVPKNVLSLLERSNKSLNDVDCFFFHQASKIVLENLQRLLNVSDDKMYINNEMIGNTVSSTIPIALKQASKSGVISDGDFLLLSGFGVGLSWGSCFIRWKDLL